MIQLRVIPCFDHVSFVYDNGQILAKAVVKVIEKLPHMGQSLLVQEWEEAILLPVGQKRYKLYTLGE